MDGEPALRPDRFFSLGDAGSVYGDDSTGEGVDGFETTEAAAEWTQRQTLWEYAPSSIRTASRASSCSGSR